MNVMDIETVIQKVTSICKKNGVEHLKLFGSYATKTNTVTSDIDFVVYGCNDVDKLEHDIAQIETLHKIDIFYGEEIYNKYLLEDIRLYGKQIY